MAWAAAGEHASRLAIATLVHLAINFGRWHVRVNEPIADEMMDRAERFYRGVDSTLRQASRNCPGGSADDDDRRLHGRQRAVLRARGPFARVSVSRRPADAVDARSHRSIASGRAGRRSSTSSASAQDRRHIVTETLGVAERGLCDSTSSAAASRTATRPPVHERADRRRRGRANRHGAPGAQVAGRPLPRTGGSRRLRRMHRRCDRPGGELWHPRTSRRRGILTPSAKVCRMSAKVPTVPRRARVPKCQSARQTAGSLTRPRLPAILWRQRRSSCICDLFLRSPSS